MNRMVPRTHSGPKWLRSVKITKGNPVRPPNPENHIAEWPVGHLFTYSSEWFSLAKVPFGASFSVLARHPSEYQ